MSEWAQEFLRWPTKPPNVCCHTWVGYGRDSASWVRQTEVRVTATFQKKFPLSFCPMAAKRGAMTLGGGAFVLERFYLNQFLNGTSTHDSATEMLPNTDLMWILNMKRDEKNKNKNATVILQLTIKVNFLTKSMTFCLLTFWNNWHKNWSCKDTDNVCEEQVVRKLPAFCDGAN